MKKWKVSLLVVVLTCAMAACATKETDASKNPPELTQEPAQLTPELAQPTPEPTAIPEPTATPRPTATPAPTPTPLPVVTETFQGVFGTYGLKAGTCLSAYMLTNQECVEFIKENYNSITFENELKPEAILEKEASIAAGDLVVKFSDNTVNMLEWCSENNMAMRGHTLIWHSQTPDWIFYENFDTSAALVSREVMLARMESYIRQVFELLESMGYLENFYAYDVVNEAWMEDGSKRDSLWLTTIGDDYLWQAFYIADKYAPDYIDLYYNDYNEQYKTDTLYNFVQTLVDEDGNYLIDGIGFQAHLYTDDDLNAYFNTVEKLGSLGLKVNLTELDVCLGSWKTVKSANETNLKEQGRYYYNLINGLLQRVEEGKVTMDSLTFWGFADHLSWRKNASPVLLDKNMTPKYAYYGALQLREFAGFEE